MINSKSFLSACSPPNIVRKYIPVNGEKNAGSSTAMEQLCGQSINSESLQHDTCDRVVKSIVKVMQAELIRAIDKLEKCIHPLT